MLSWGSDLVNKLISISISVIDRVVMFILDYTRYLYQMIFMWLISNSTGGISGTGNAYPSGAPDVSIFRGYTLFNTQF
jgi:hypothetical protein